MTYEMRKIKTGDIYKMSRILKKLNIKTDLKDGISMTQAGVQVFQKALENLYQAENEVNEFMADLVGITPEEFADLPIGETLKIFNEFRKQEDIKTFLELAGK